MDRHVKEEEVDVLSVTNDAKAALHVVVNIANNSKETCVSCSKKKVSKN